MEVFLTINDLVFDGLISLDEKLEYRPRLATSWTQSEEAFFVVEPRYLFKNIGNRLPDPKDWMNYIQTSIKGDEY